MEEPKPESEPLTPSENDEVPPLEEWTKEAENGSEKSQLALGLHFLKLAESGLDRKENGVKAVNWLVEASKQGNEMATVKIRHCLVTDLGITEENSEDVVWCVNTSSAEKKIRSASKKLFSSLNPSQANMSQEQYLEAINKLPLLDDRQRKLMTAAVKKIGSSITENAFVGVLSKKIQGTLTLSASDVGGDSSADYQSSSYARRALVYPKQFASDALDHSLEYCSKQGMDLILSFIPTGQIYVLLSIFFYSFLTFSTVFFLIPLVIFYISAAVTIVATLQMFYKRRKKKDSDNLAGLLQQFDTGLDLNSTASQYSWNSLTPYLIFFGSLLIMVISFSVCNKNYLPTATLFVTCNVMTMFCFYALSDTHDIVTLTALGAHFFSSLPVYLSNFPPIPVLKYLYTPIVTLPLGSGFLFNLSLSSIVYLTIPLLMIRMAMKDSWTGIYKIVIPHLVCYFWFSFSTTVFPYTTWFEIARATLAYITLPLLFPFLAVILTVYGLYKLMFVDTIGKIGITALFLAIPLILSKTNVMLGKKGVKLSPQMERVKKYVMIGFTVLSIVPLLFIHTSLSQSSKVVEIGWKDYKELCIPKQGEIIAPYQKTCHDLLGYHVRWQGIVEQVQISEVENNVEMVVNALPGLFAAPLRCFYGKPLSDCDSETMSRKEFKRCEILQSNGQFCHLDEYDELSFSVSVKVDDAVVNLAFGNSFKSKLLVLSPGDNVEFAGSLKVTGTPSPSIKAKSINCTNRVLPEIQKIRDLDKDLVFEIVEEAASVAVNFALFPVISYVPEETENVFQ